MANGLPLSTQSRRRTAVRELIGSASRETGIAIPASKGAKARAQMVRFEARLRKKQQQGQIVTEEEIAEFEGLARTFGEEKKMEQLFETFRKEISGAPEPAGLADPVQRERSFSSDPRLREDFGTLLT